MEEQTTETKLVCMLSNLLELCWVHCIHAFFSLDMPRRARFLLHLWIFLGASRGNACTSLKSLLGKIWNHKELQLFYLSCSREAQLIKSILLTQHWITVVYTLTPNIFPTVNGVLSSKNGVSVKESDLNNELWIRLVNNLEELSVYPGAVKNKSNRSLVCSLTYSCLFFLFAIAKEW